MNAAIREAKDLAEMHKIAKAHGYSGGWAFTRWGIEQKRRRKRGEQTVLVEAEKAVMYA